MPDFCPCVTRMDNSQLSVESNLGLLCFVLLRSVVGPEKKKTLSTNQMQNLN